MAAWGTWLGLAVAVWPARAQNEKEPERPLIVVNAASVERLMSQAVTTFEAAGRPELSETLGGALARVNDLKGLARNQSVGLMIYMNGLVPDPVAYVPVKDIADLMKTVEIGPVTTRQVSDNRFEIVGQRQTIHVRVQRDYAFVSNNRDALDREFTDPVRLTGKLSTSYDLAASINLKSLSPTTRELLMSVLRANFENDLQRRDNEPAAAHRMRRAAGMRNLEVIDQLVTQGEELTVGWTVSPVDKAAGLEIVLTATPGSEFAAYFNELKGTRSRFANLLSSKQPMTASISWKLDKSARKMWKEIVSAAEAELVPRLPGEGEDPAEHPITRLAKVLNATADSGHVDAIFQFVGKPPGPFVLIGGAKFAEPEILEGLLGEILARLKSNPNLSEVRLDALTHKGVTFHRFSLAQMGADEERLYGVNPAIHVGSGDSIVWFAVGGDDAVSELKRAIDKTAEPVPDSFSPAPIQFVMNLSNWMDIFDPNNRPDGFAALARSSFSKGGDAVRVDVRPIDDGVRFRVQFDEAFIRLVGAAVAERLDRQQ